MINVPQLLPTLKESSLMLGPANELPKDAASAYLSNYLCHLPTKTRIPPTAKLPVVPPYLRVFSGLCPLPRIPFPPYLFTQSYLALQSVDE